MAEISLSVLRKEPIHLQLSYERRPRDAEQTRRGALIVAGLFHHLQNGDALDIIQANAIGFRRLGG